MRAEGEVLHAWVDYLAGDEARMLLALAAVVSLRHEAGALGDLAATSSHYLTIYDNLNRS